MRFYISAAFCILDSFVGVAMMKIDPDASFIMFLAAGFLAVDAIVQLKREDKEKK